MEHVIRLKLGLTHFILKIGKDFRMLPIKCTYRIITVSETQGFQEHAQNNTFSHFGIQQNTRGARKKKEAESTSASGAKYILF